VAFYVPNLIGALVVVTRGREKAGERVNHHPSMMGDAFEFFSLSFSQQPLHLPSFLFPSLSPKNRLHPRRLRGLRLLGRSDQPCPVYGVLLLQVREV
jgi:hypothetical protein